MILDALQKPALWTEQWHSSSAFSSRRTCAVLSGAREAHPFHVARRDPRDKHIAALTD